LLAALALGAAGAVGSSYNFAAPIYHRMIAAFAAGDLAAAREEQFRAVGLIDLLGGFGYTAAAKAVMGFLGVDVGPARLPFAPLATRRTARTPPTSRSSGAPPRCTPAPAGPAATGRRPRPRSGRRSPASRRTGPSRTCRPGPAGRGSTGAPEPRRPP